MKQSRSTFHVSRFMQICALLFALTLSSGAWADVAPPEQPPGSNISPNGQGQTQVVMSAESIIIEVRPSMDTATATAKVMGDFVMRNTGTAAEAMAVRFPLGDPGGKGSGFGQFPSVENFAVQVSGEVVPTSVITTPNPLPGQTEPLKWAVFDVNFPPGQDTAINVTYNIMATGYPPSARFTYVLETGAGWKDTIGSADITLRLPYTATNDNVFHNESKTTPGWKLAGNEVRWHWDNLEPTAKDNIQVTILAPKAWYAILTARASLEARPDDAGALVSLAESYHAAITSKFPLDENDPFATKSEETYALALAAQPRSAAIHAQYARAIWDHMGVPVVEADDPNLLRVLAEISEALAIDPQNANAKALLAEIEPSVQGTVVVPTAIGSAPPSPIVTAGPDIEGTVGSVPTRTLAPPVGTMVAIPSPKATPTNQSGATGETNTLPLVLGIVALPVIAALATFLIVTKRREQR